MPKNVKKSLGVHPKFTGFKVDHLDKIARSNAKHAHELSDTHPVHKRVLNNLHEIDKKNRKEYPQLNVSLEKKYKAIKRLAVGLGDADDGGIPMKVIHDHLKSKRKSSK